ncbi:MAG: glycosyltransferase family 2 protein [Chloroflexi bacterium]|nr:glycosyltransferase family 2 protein [Chloroflexota bacterium]
MSPKVSVVILNWNGRRYLDDCFTSLQAQTYADFEIILVDNGSTDGSVEWMAEHFPQVRMICNETNLGFAAGNNQAIRVSQAEFIVTLNNDTRVEPDWLASLVAVAEEDPTVGMCASKMLFADRPEIINSTGINLDPVGIAWDRRGGEPDDGQETEPVEIFGPCAGAALYRRTMLDQIGLFDERFFAYLEDVDLAWRARLAGFRCLYVPQARVYHVHSATAGESSPFKNRLLGRNKVWVIAKNYGPGGWLLLYLPLIVLYDLAAVLYALVVRRDISSLQGRLEGLRGLPGVWRRRREVQALRRENRGQPWHRHLSPLIPPWRVPARYRHLRTADRQD